MRERCTITSSIRVAKSFIMDNNRVNAEGKCTYDTISDMYAFTVRSVDGACNFVLATKVNGDQKGEIHDYYEVFYSDAVTHSLAEGYTVLEIQSLAAILVREEGIAEDLGYSDFGRNGFSMQTISDAVIHMYSRHAGNLGYAKAKVLG